MADAGCNFFTMPQIPEDPHDLLAYVDKLTVGFLRGPWPYYSILITILSLKGIHKEERINKEEQEVEEQEIEEQDCTSFIEVRFLGKGPEVQY